MNKHNFVLLHTRVENSTLLPNQSREYGPSIEALWGCHCGKTKMTTHFLNGEDAIVESIHLGREIN